MMFLGFIQRDQWINKWIKHLLQDFSSVSDNFGTLCIKGLTFTT